MQETTKPKPFCFVLMPFDDTFSDIYTLGIKEACKEAGTYCERVDEQIYEGGILDRIYNQISKADIVIADMTGRNPNVFYEVGYAHALGKSTILLTQKTEDIPFDLKHYPHIVYSNKITTLKEELTKRVLWYVNNPDEKPEEKLDIEVYNDGISLQNGSHTFKGRPYDSLNDIWGVDLDLSFKNNSASTFYHGDFKVGMILPGNYERIWNAKNNGIIETTLPEGKKLAMLPDLDTLFPNAYVSFALFPTFKKLHDTEEIIVRIYSSVGSRDFILKVTFK